jgi:hypothetical protein
MITYNQNILENLKLANEVIVYLEHEPITDQQVWNEAKHCDTFPNFGNILLQLSYELIRSILPIDVKTYFKFSVDLSDSCMYLYGKEIKTLNDFIKVLKNNNIKL